MNKPFYPYRDLPPCLLWLLVLANPFGLGAQLPPLAREGGAPNPAQMNIGRFYGKVIDESTGKGIGYASVQLTAMRYDSAARTMREKVVAGQLTEPNGDFSLGNLPILGTYTLKISYLGYATVERKVSFDLSKLSQMPRGGFDLNAIHVIDRDLGNIPLAASSRLLKEVTVTAEASSVVLALDRKVYRVDKDGIAAGGTAEDALRNVPSVQVDIDGNVTLRNAAPQIFVDGRPTTLTLDQIPAESIEQIEVITNPSAKYDASGGNAGIINIVLKKERRKGYNGNVRAGIDMRGRINAGGDFNVREGKINAFVMGGLFDRKTLGEGETERLNRFGSFQTDVYQDVQTTINRRFMFARTGLDWFINNRNTLTLAGNYAGGRFVFWDDIRILTDSLANGNLLGSSFALREAESHRQFDNLGVQVLYKLLFPQPGKELTADININSAGFNNRGNFETRYEGLPVAFLQRQDDDGSNDQYTFQADFVNPINGSSKLEAGIRGALRDFRRNNASFQFDPAQKAYIRAPTFADQYAFLDQVYAAYTTYSHSYKQWGYQIGLRAEASFYQGDLPDIDSSFAIQYPISLFPSVFLTYKFNEEDNIQLNYSRRVNRPNFFQLSPFPDFSDSLLLNRGNPGLLPEFTHSIELSYQNIFNRQHNLLATVYYKRATNLIANYQFPEFNALLGRDVIVSTFINANSSTAYGAEFTLKNTLGKRIELTSNLNFYNSVVNSNNIESNLSREQFTWFIKENLNVKLPSAITLQVAGSYQSRTAFAFGANRGGPHGGWGGPTSTAQGYSIPVWFIDISLRKDFFKDRRASVTLAIQDVFASRRNGSFSESALFIQETWRIRDPQFIRLNFSYRFGKFDLSLFKRKNLKMGGDENMGIEVN
ncbi:MAG: TonB-dependent receptor [Saprospiraceae bacterium]|nr:TonB-dependent receptor [Saprospiraceae bacterium]MDW8485282.1 TonB-dependent receptor [Saprospiraceae bacterium]